MAGLPIQRRLDEQFPANPNDPVAPNWRRLMLTLELRLQTLEKQRSDYEAAIQDLRNFGIERINEVLLPAYQQVIAYTTLGWLLVRSKSELTLVAGEQALFVVNEGPSRELFTPTPFLAVQRESTPADFGVARLITYHKASGSLYVEILSLFGNFPMGPHSDWVITAAPGVSESTKFWFEQVMAAGTNTSADAAQTAADRAYVQAAREALEAAGLNPDQFAWRDGTRPFNAVQSGVAPGAAADGAQLVTANWTRLRATEATAALNTTLQAGAPATLNTFAKLAAAIGNDPNFASTANFLRLTGGTLTGGLVLSATAGLTLQANSPGITFGGPTPHLLKNESDGYFGITNPTGQMGAWFKYPAGTNEALCDTWFSGQVGMGGNLTVGGAATSIAGSANVGGNLAVTGSINISAGVLYLPHMGQPYYLQRTVGGRWQFVEGSGAIFYADPGGNCTVPGNLAVGSGVSASTVVVGSTLGIHYSGLSGYWVGFGWNGNLNMYINGGYQGDVATTTYVETRAAAHANAAVVNNNAWISGTFATSAWVGTYFSYNWHTHEGSYMPAAPGTWWHAAAGAAWSASPNFWSVNAATTIGAGGAVSGTQFVQISDARLKRNILPESRGYEIVRGLKPISFDRMITTGDEPEHARSDTTHELGFMAQEVEKVLPEAVVKLGIAPPDGSREPMLGVSLGPIVAVCVNALHEIYQRLEALERK